MNYNDLLLIVAKEYTCKLCNYKTRNKNNFQKHLLTRKHENTTKYYEKLQNISEQYICECGKTYPYRASLYNHRKKCIKSQEIQNSTNNDGENKIKMALSECKKNTNKLTIPTIGIGASNFCDGQVLVTDDIINLDPNNYKPKFIKTYTVAATSTQ